MPTITSMPQAVIRSAATTLENMPPSPTADRVPQASALISSVTAGTVRTSVSAAAPSAPSRRRISPATSVSSSA